jgi:hypothetical protein
MSIRTRTAGIATTMLVTGGLGMAGLGLAAGTAHAEPFPAPTYHWCPGDFWDPGWGFNWDFGVCHDDHHRDIDADDHSRDWWGDQGWRGDRDWGGQNWGGQNWVDHSWGPDRGPGPGLPWWPR